jgi:hypothetical protein
MKFSPFDWKEIQYEKPFNVKAGPLRLRSSLPCALYISSQGVEALVGVSTTHEVDLSHQGEAKVIAPEKARVFLHSPDPTEYTYEGEVFTNIDLLPSETGPVAEVTRAMRNFKREQAAAIREMRQERQALELSLKAAAPPSDPAAPPAADPPPSAPPAADLDPAAPPAADAPPARPSNRARGA